MPILSWVGKDKVKNHHHDVPFRLLNTQYTFTANEGTPSNSTGNKIIHGDNLEALKSLLPEYEGKVNCIYIDPPYNTGNEGWVYNDNVNDPKIKKWLGQVVGKEGEDLSRHDKWLCMMYPRLKLLHRLLADDGVIFISIDDNEQAHLKLVMDEVFGTGKFIADIAVINNLKGRSDDKYVATAHEHLLLYRKGSFETYGVPVPEEYIQEYKLSDDRGAYRLQGLRKRGSNSKRSDRPNMFYPFYIDIASNSISLNRINDSDIEVFPRLSDGSDGCWRWGKETALARINDLVADVVKTRNEFDVFQKDYLTDGGKGKRIKPKSFWMGSEFSSDSGTKTYKEIMLGEPFDYPKSVDLISYCLEQVANPNSIILDSFAGSGTTAHAVLKQNAQDGGNRKFILIEMMDYAETITAERVRRVMNGYGKGNKAVAGLGGSFDYVTVGEPLFLDDGNLNEVVGETAIRQYVAYSERVTLDTSETMQAVNRHCLGLKEDALFVLYYETNAITALSMDFLATLAVKNLSNRPNSYVIYADKCTLTPEIMRKYGITFKRIPRDITRF